MKKNDLEKKMKSLMKNYEICKNFLESHLDLINKTEDEIQQIA